MEESIMNSTLAFLGKILASIASIPERLISQALYDPGFGLRDTVSSFRKSIKLSVIAGRPRFGVESSLTSSIEATNKKMLLSSGNELITLDSKPGCR
jgi:hypothetical protein